MSGVSKELLGGIVYSSYVVSVWHDLQERFDKVDGSRTYQLHKEIATIHQVRCREGDSMSLLARRFTSLRRGLTMS
ncbi:hypothetical protein P3L10_031915 [Capsicum annuum]